MSAFDAMDVDVLEAVKLPFRAEVPPPRAHLRFEPSPARQPRKERLVPVPIDRFDLRVELFKYRLKKAEERVFEMDIDNQVKRPELRKNEVLSRKRRAEEDLEEEPARKRRCQKSFGCLDHSNTSLNT